MGAVTADSPVGIFSSSTFVAPLFCSHDGMFLMTTFTEPVVPPLLPTTMIALALSAS